VLGETDVIPYSIYAKMYEYNQTPPGYGYICRIDSFEPNVTILSILIGDAKEIYIHIITLIDNIPYIVKTYEIRIS